MLRAHHVLGTRTIRQEVNLSILGIILTRTIIGIELYSDEFQQGTLGTVSRYLRMCISRHRFARLWHKNCIRRGIIMSNIEYINTDCLNATVTNETNI